MMYHTRGKDLQTSLLVAQIILAGNYHFTRMTELEWNAHSLKGDPGLCYRVRHRLWLQKNGAWDFASSFISFQISELQFLSVR